ncbi:hypothetical protein O181_084822 [Austropuccinia psidii MF-1]|uniref:DUF4219 domain-containing protein n=1 Tax=Austropuccinia psidii MF-1 TaxID=1389203 RepID=A0A9Q3FUY2_9BASI|nr:hypothetical protein [Austropuccinia psidii MF-1]
MNDKTLDIKNISTIPVLDGTNYVHWKMRMKIHLRSRDLLDVCENSQANDTSTSSFNKWKMASFEAINLIIIRITKRVFRKVVNSETIENSHSLWTKIPEKYNGKTDANTVTTNNGSNTKKEHDSSAFITSFEEPHKIIFFCSHGKHNKRCTTYKKEYFWEENPHLRPSRLEKERKNNPEAHLSIAQALMKIGGPSVPTHEQVVVDCGATHNMFNSPKFFHKQFKKVDSKVATGDSNSQLLAQGIGTVQLEFKGQNMNLRNCPNLPKLKFNLISMLGLFKDSLTIQEIDNTFSLILNNKKLLKGQINNRLMHIAYNLRTTLLTTLDKKLWHY